MKSIQNSDYTQTVVVKTSPRQAFDALTSFIHHWWGPVDKQLSKAGDIFTVSWGPAYYRFEVSQWDPPDHLTWRCIDANQIIRGLEGVAVEWVGNELSWTIVSRGTNRVEISLIHRGLRPSCRCYEFCSASWDRYIGQELKRYLEGGG